MQINQNNLENLRSETGDLAAEAFSRDVITQEHFEVMATRIVNADSREQLLAIRGELVIGEQRFAPQVISAQGSVVRERGPWIESPDIRVEAKSSVIRLDFRYYIMLSDFQIHLDLDLRSSMLRIDLPRDVTVKEQLSSRRGSVLKLRRDRGEPDRYLVMTGDMENSVVKIRLRGRRSRYLKRMLFKELTEK